MSFKAISAVDSQALLIKRYLFRDYRDDLKTTNDFFTKQEYVVFGMFENEGMVAFVVLEDLRHHYETSNYSEMYWLYQNIMSEERAKGFQVIRVWVFGAPYPLEHCIPRILRAFHEQREEKKELLILSFNTTSAPKWSAWEQMLCKLGFEKSPIEYANLKCKIPASFRTKSEAMSSGLSLDGYDIRSMDGEPYSLRALATCYNEAFFSGAERMSEEGIARTVEDPSFCPALSFLGQSQCDGNIVGFLFAKRWGNSAEVDLLGVAPAHQRKGLVKNAIQLLFQRAGSLGISSLFWEINVSNSPIRTLLERYLPVEVVERKYTHLCITRGRQKVPLQDFLLQLQS